MPHRPSKTLDTELPLHKLPYRALITLAGFFLLGLFLILLPKPPQYHPQVIFEAGPIQVEFLLHSQSDPLQCQKTVDAITGAMSANCPGCKTVKHTCLQTLDKEQQKLLSDSPIEVYSTRNLTGVVAYRGNTDDAKVACESTVQKGRELNAAIPSTCHPAGEARPLSAVEQERARIGQQIFMTILYAMGTVLITLLAFTLLNYQKYRAWALKTTAVAGKKEPAARPTYPLLQKLFLASTDTLILTGIFMAFSWPASDDLQRWNQTDQKMVIGQIFVIILTIGLFWIRLEHYAKRRPFWDELREVVRVLASMLLVSAAIAFVAGLEIGRLNLLLAGLLNLIFVPVGRAAARTLLDDLGLWKIPALIIGTGQNAHDAYLALNVERSMGYQILGLIHTSSDNAQDSVLIKNQSITVFPLSTLKNIPDSIQIVVALDNLTEAYQQKLARSILSNSRNKVHIIPSIRGLPLHGTQISHFFSHEVLLLTIRNNLSRRSLQWIKRCFDIIGATALLLILFPLMLYIGWRIRQEDGGPIIFVQQRVGKGGKLFNFLKFRSMLINADTMLQQWKETNSIEWQEYYSNNFKLKNDPRLLGIGAWIRAFSIDELPQLINVLRGEMSLVGPRPLLARELTEYGDSINYYQQTHPGITGLWQVSGRSQTKFRDRAFLDEWYIRNWSLWYDLAILFKTVKVVLNRDGAY